MDGAWHGGKCFYTMHLLKMDMEIGFSWLNYVYSKYIIKMPERPRRPHLRRRVAG